MKRLLLVGLGVILMASLWGLWSLGLQHWVLGIRNSEGQVDPNKYYPANERFNPPVPQMGVGLVVHGLNLDPAAMNDLTYLLAKQGLILFRGNLQGHRVKIDEYDTATREGWLQEIVELHRLARADDPHKPMVCAGFSLGALLILDAQSQGRVSCDRMVLLAPAVKVHVPSWLMKAARLLLPEMLTLPTAVPLAYRRHDRLVLKPNFLAMESMLALESSTLSGLNVPTLVLGSDGDEVVDIPALRKWIQEKNLSSWHFESVSVSGTENPKPVHHLIVDEKSLGHKEWKRVSDLISQFLAFP